MPAPRAAILGHPHTYHIEVWCALSQPLFAQRDEAERVVQHCELLRRAFDARLFAYHVATDHVRVVLRHQVMGPEREDRLRQRWASIGGAATTQIARIRERFSTLSGFMQTFLQRYSRDWNHRHHSRGHVWAGRYRACLLADDTALAAAVLCLDECTDAVVATRDNADLVHPVTLATLPLRLGPDGSLFTSDEAPPGLPPLRGERHDHLTQFRGGLAPGDSRAYALAIRNGWALGRPDSLSDAVARLGRSAGRGRSRQLRELDDRLGLCGVWG